jgi:hypothetical protein
MSIRAPLLVAAAAVQMVAALRLPLGNRRCPARRFACRMPPGQGMRLLFWVPTIAIDSDLGDEGWRDATRVTRWYEANPGDHSQAPVKNVGYLTCDERFFYAAFEFDDPDPSRIRAPYSDRDVAAIQGHRQRFPRSSRSSIGNSS